MKILSLDATLDKIGPYLGLIVAALFVSFISVAITRIVWTSSEKQAAYRAYTECLREMQGKSIDVIQTFCGRIRDQL